MNEPILPEALRGAPHIAAFDKIIRYYNSNSTDLVNADPVEAAINILNIETCPEALLHYVAEMWGVEGWKGFDYCTTDNEKRDLLRLVRKLNDKHGTKWTLKTMLEVAGFTNVVITDHMSYVHFLDGSWQLNGTVQLMSNNMFWADFKVEMTSPNPYDLDVVKRYINYWKRGSSRLVELRINTIVFTNLLISP